MVGNDLLVRNDHISERNYQRPESSDSKAFFSDGSTKRQSSKIVSAPVAAIVLDMGEASREQGFRLNGCR